MIISPFEDFGGMIMLGLCKISNFHDLFIVCVKFHFAFNGNSFSEGILNVQKKTILNIGTGLFLTLLVTGCTSTEKDIAVGTAAGAALGGIAGGGKGALIGAGVGAVGGLLVRELEGGNCQYRHKKGHIYTAPCQN